MPAPIVLSLLKQVDVLIIVLFLSLVFLIVHLSLPLSGSNQDVFDEMNADNAYHNNCCSALGNRVVNDKLIDTY